MYVVLLLLLAAEGRPFVYWGARSALVAFEASPRPSPSAQVLELHAARDGEHLVLRLSFDRPVREALHLSDGTPVSGRLKAVVYIDTDDDRATGVQQGSGDLRTGSERRIELGAVAVGADPEEGRQAAVLVSATLHALTREGRRRTRWRADDGDPARLRFYGDAVELRLAFDDLGNIGGMRLVLVSGDEARDGRLAAEP
jgi:hypothetical protein